MTDNRDDDDDMLLDATEPVEVWDNAPLAESGPPVFDGEAPLVAVGQAVLYAPDACHAGDHLLDADGNRIGELVDVDAMWPARVRRIHGAGVCDLDIQHPNGFVTLHYDGRSYAPDGRRGSWRLPAD